MKAATVERGNIQSIFSVNTFSFEGEAGSIGGPAEVLDNGSICHCLFVMRPGYNPGQHASVRQPIIGPSQIACDFCRVEDGDLGFDLILFKQAPRGHNGEVPAIWRRRYHFAARNTWISMR